MKTIIGILGGMGPRATVEFEQRLLDKLAGTDQQIPTIISINDGSIPDRSSYLLGSGEDPVPAMACNLKLLVQMGASFVCIPCNSASAPAILDRLRLVSPIPLVDPPSEVGKFLTMHKYGKIYILGTKGMIASGTYQSICSSLGIDCVEPSPAVQRATTTIIQAVKSNRQHLMGAAAQVIRQAIINSGCDTVILGCTELPCVASLLVPTQIAAIDTLDILAAACAIYATLKETKNEPRPIYA